MTTATSDEIPGIEWSAVGWAATVSAIAFLIAGSVATAFSQGGNAWTFLKMTASMLLGQQTIFNDIDFVTLVTGLIMHLMISIVGTILLVLVINRWGLLVGLIGGGLLGLALYGINFYFVSDLFFPWLSGLRSVGLAVAHIIFGAVAGTVYELLDVD